MTHGVFYLLALDSLYIEFDIKKFLEKDLCLKKFASLCSTLPRSWFMCQIIVLVFLFLCRCFSLVFIWIKAISDVLHSDICYYEYQHHEGNFHVFFKKFKLYA
jgi:hypothetical protein